jgi:hypothetical protein
MAPCGGASSRSFPRRRAFVRISPACRAGSRRCRPHAAARGLVLSLLIVAAGGANPDAFRAVIEDIVSVVAKSPDMSELPPKRWTPLLSSFWSRKVFYGYGTSSISG